MTRRDRRCATRCAAPSRGRRRARAVVARRAGGVRRRRAAPAAAAVGVARRARRADAGRRRGRRRRERADSSDIGRWVRGVLGVGERDAAAGARARARRRPAARAGRPERVGRRERRAKRRLGVYSGTAWSPHGLFVVGWHGRELTALEPGGDVRWSMARARARRGRRAGRPVDGFRIAYVGGLGAAHRQRRRHAATVATAPRAARSRPPGDRTTSTSSRTSTRAVAVSVVAVDSRTRLWRSARCDRRARAGLVARRAAAARRDAVAPHRCSSVPAGCSSRARSRPGSS